MTESTPHVDLELIEPSIVSVRLVGKIDEVEITKLVDGFEPFVRNKTVWGFEADMREIAGATPEARRIAAQRLSSLPKMCVAVITTGFGQRIIAKLVLTAIQMLKPGHLDVKFFNTKETARSWLQATLAERG